ncbi:MAG: cytidine deaminase [Lachnospiraceae bacterium]|jgi:cytidine deaminase|nr:cytidine deaminase [Lachnospiraceae bacterium]
MTNETIENLIKSAFRVLEHAYVPYSHFKVGAALLTSDGEIYTGCNIENGAFTPTNCAERTAFFKAISEGKRDFTCIVVVNEREDGLHDYCPPCGVCRQVMSEFCKPDFTIILAKSETDYKTYTLDDLLPLRFEL